jgi:hypothetical protein
VTIASQTRAGSRRRPATNYDQPPFRSIPNKRLSVISDGD